MGYAANLLNLDEVYNTSSQTPILVNDFNISTMEDRETLNKLIYTHYDGDTLNIVPSCECGTLKGEFNVGMRCPDCNTLVMAVTERPLESVLWLAPPKGVATYINPMIWILLSKALTYNSINLLEYLVNPTLVISGNVHKNVRKLQSLNIDRGINYFYKNFDTIIRQLADNNILKGSKADILQMVAMYRDSLFCQYLPMPSKLGFITEKTAVNSYADTTMLLAVDALRTISAVVNSIRPLSSKVIQARAMQANAMLAQYHDSFIKKSLGTKEGWYRSHAFGARLHFSFRAVINSLSENHEYDELHLPWSVAIMVFKLHLTNKLTRIAKFTPNECNQFLYEHMQKHHPLIEEMFKELIAESPYGGIPTLFSRNPTLQRGSMQLFRITKIKNDPHINSVSISVLCLKAPNADFDGDALNGIVVLDRRMYQALERLAPHLGILDTRMPRTLSKNGIIPAPVISTIGAWLHEGE